MFSNSKGDKVAFFGAWADSACARSYRSEALRICTDGIERSIEIDLRECPQIAAALYYLEQNSDRTGGVKRYRRALTIPDPEARTRELATACKDIARATAMSTRPDW